jgi:hypothetical protein
LRVGCPQLFPCQEVVAKREVTVVRVPRGVGAELQPHGVSIWFGMTGGYGNG